MCYGSDTKSNILIASVYIPIIIIMFLNKRKKLKHGYIYYDDIGT